MKHLVLVALILCCLNEAGFAQTPKPKSPPAGASATAATAGAKTSSAAPAAPNANTANSALPAESDSATDVANETANANSMFSGFMDPFDYDTRGRRDPFVIPTPDKAVEQGTVAGPLLPLQKFDLGQLRLIGIIWDVKRPKAMIKDPTGATHVVGTNTKVGPRNGYIAVIREGEMVVVETQEQEGRLVSSAQVVKIAR